MLKGSQLRYFDTTEAFNDNKPALNAVPYDMRYCRVEEINDVDSSLRFQFKIAPKNARGGDRELLVEVRESVTLVCCRFR